jgi:inward rectifier potassium channel
MLKSIFNRTTERELGFGTTATVKGRLMNADGSFRVERIGMEHGSNFFHTLLTMSWGRFSMIVFGFYTLTNLIFAVLYLFAGIENIRGTEVGGLLSNFLDAFFFSAQTLTTVGYGGLSPHGFWTNVLASLESLAGLMAFALISGLMYGRFSRPSAKIKFSSKMVVAPFENGSGLMFRMANARKSELLETETTMILAINQERENGEIFRRFYNMDLQLSKVTFFSLNWTVVHPITEKSPIFGLSQEELIAAHAEILVLVKGVDDTYAQQVQARTSFLAEEIEWNAKFSPIVGQSSKGVPQIMLEKIGEILRIESWFFEVLRKKKTRTPKS